MKAGKIHIRFIELSIVFLFVVNNVGFSQGTESRKKYSTGSKVYAGILVTPQSAGIINNNFSASGALNQKSGTSLGFALEGGYYFSEIAGISIGAGIGSYSAKLTLDSCSFKFPATDMENEAYDMRIKGKTIAEDQKISFLSIPICLVIRIPSGEKLGFYAKAGTNLNIPIVKTYKGSGTFTYDGYYAAYPVLLQDIPIYFPSKKLTNASGNLELKSISLAIIASGGVTYELNKSLQLSLGLVFNKSIGNISGFVGSSENKLTSKPDELNSIMACSSDAGIQSFGLSIGIKYYLK